jgi:flagellin-like protein
MRCAVSRTRRSAGDSEAKASRRAGFRRNRRHRGVSDVVATIILLALTVVLFSAIFAFVNTFPAPPAQNSNQFQATLLYQGNASNPGTTVVGAISILHLAGPSIPGSGLVYLKSATHPAGPEFANAIAISAGLNGSGSWNLGQNWFYKFPSNQWPILPDNITIYITSGSSLVFSVILPGQTINTPPTVTQTWVVPATPGVGVSFTVYATVAGSVSGLSVSLDLSTVPGAPTGPQPMSQNAAGQWYLMIPAGDTTTNGTYVGFVHAVNANGQIGSGTVNVIVAASTISVTVGFSSYPVVQGSSPTLVATVTYSGVGAATSVSIAFWAAQGSTRVYAGVGPSPVTITGAGTSSYQSTTTWTIPYTTLTYTVTASVNVTGVGNAIGTLSFTPAVPLALYVFLAGTAASTCTNSSSGTCPYVEANLWDNGTGTSAIAYTVKCYINNTATGKSFQPAISGSPSTITPGTVVLLKTTNRWQPTKTTSYVITVVVTVTGVGRVVDTYVFNDLT